MRKRLLSLLLTVAMVLSLLAFPVSAETATSGTCGYNLTWKLNDGVLTISGTGEMTDYKSGSAPWYSDRKSITSVVIEDGVTSIGWYAFYGCSSLTSINIPDGVTSIGYYAFEGCKSLTSIAIPDEVTSIGDQAFYGCSSLTSINIPDGVTSIGFSTFYGCSSLTSITIPTSVTSIGYATFDGCKKLTSIEIPEGVTSIGGNAFDGCSSLTSITIPDSVTSIGDHAFSGCSSLTSITIPDRVTSIGEYVFDGCSSLTSITIPEGVTSIGAYAFAECHNMTRITIPGSVISVGEGAFWDCSRLTGVTIPSGVTSIGSYAFYNCAGLTSVTIPEGVTSIDAGAFKDCSGLTSISIPKNVYEIKDFAFFNCNNLEDVYYSGSEKDWNRITIGTNSRLTDANIHFNRVAPVISRFDDVNIPTEYYYDPVYWAVEKGITKGTDETHFSPDDPCKREHVVTFLWRAAGCPEPSTTVSPFVDVQDSSAYYYKAVLWAAENDITKGTDDTHFSPDDTCTRAQIVTFLWRYENKPEPTSTVNPFVDVPSGEYYYNAVLWAAENKITTGTDDTHFSPDDPCLRAQIVTFLYRDLAK